MERYNLSVKEREHPFYPGVWNSVVDMVPEKDGQWVKWEDYERLLREYEKLDDDYTQLARGEDY